MLSAEARRSSSVSTAFASDALAQFRMNDTEAKFEVCPPAGYARGLCPSDSRRAFLQQVKNCMDFMEKEQMKDQSDQRKAVCYLYHVFRNEGVDTNDIDA